MAQYTDTDGVSDVGRAFVVSAPEIKVITSTGVVSVTTGQTKMPFIAQVTVPFADLTAAATAHNALLTALKNAGHMATS